MTGCVILGATGTCPCGDDCSPVTDMACFGLDSAIAIDGGPVKCILSIDRNIKGCGGSGAWVTWSA